VTSCCSLSLLIPFTKTNSLLLFCASIVCLFVARRSAVSSCPVVVCLSTGVRHSTIPTGHPTQRKSTNPVTEIHKISGEHQFFPIPQQRECYSAAIRRSTPSSLASNPRQAVDDFAVTLDGAQIAQNVLLTSAPPAYSSDPPAYSLDPPENEDPDLSSSSSPPEPPECASGRLHPRVAVLLGLNNRWHKWLYMCRLASVLPELLFGIPILWNLFWLALSEETGWTSLRAGGKASRLLVELFLAAIWVNLLHSPILVTNEEETYSSVVCCFWLSILLLHGLFNDAMVCTLCQT
jgi:hypothetical protein